MTLDTVHPDMVLTSDTFVALVARLQMGTVFPNRKIEFHRVSADWWVVLTDGEPRLKISAIQISDYIQRLTESGFGMQTVSYSPTNRFHASLMGCDFWSTMGFSIQPIQHF